MGVWRPSPLAVPAVARDYQPMDGRLFGSATAAILLFTCSTISSSAERESICHEISLQGLLRAGEQFSSKIGGGLELRLLPMRFSDPSTATPLDDWRLDLVPTEAAGSMQKGADRIYPVNLPLRFNPWQDIGSTYGLTVEQKLERRILYHFGTIRFTATDYRTAEHGKTIVEIGFLSQIIAPEHALAADNPQAAPCPAKQ